MVQNQQSMIKLENQFQNLLDSLLFLIDFIKNKKNLVIFQNSCI